MLAKLLKVLSLIIAILLLLVQVDQSFALPAIQNHDLQLSKLETDGPNLIPPYRHLLNDTDLEADYWEQIFPPQSPDARYIHGMAYDINNNAMVLFGGDPDGKGHHRLGDTWEYESGNWSQVLPEESPPGRVNINNAMVYDQSRGKIILFGGLSQAGHMNDTWEYFRDGAIRVWEPITPTVKPMVRDTHAMTYDSARERTVMFGGWSPVQSGFYLQDTWEYKDNDWSSITTVISPTARHQHALAFDSQRGVVVLFGGRDTPTTTLNDTWEYDGSNWQLVPTTNSPSPRSSHAMAYDAKRNVVVLFGGLDDDGSTIYNDTWEYDGIDWTQVETGVSPSERYGTPMAYDNHRGKMLFFGGGVKNGNFHTSDETWEYSVWGNNQSIYLPIITK